MFTQLFETRTQKQHMIASICKKSPLEDAVKRQNSNDG